MLSAVPTRIGNESVPTRVGNESVSTEDDLAFENLYPALIECFAIIFCGYVAGKLNVISATEAKGLNTFVGTFSLPALIFLSMATLNLNEVNWQFLSSILLAKAVIFVVVIVITLLVTRPIDLSKAGLLAIFCTQSNDFALGYPIIKALYDKTHPEYASYLYLMAPISLVILNPIAFLMMELGKRRAAIVSPSLSLESSDSEISTVSSTSQTRTNLCVSIIGKVLFNPVVLMTTLGIIGNSIFQQNLPSVLSGILKVFANAFSAAALFLLGLRMVGQVSQLRGANLVTPCILICVKCLVLPIVAREMVTSLHAGADANETLDLSNFGFLYGTFPTAPSVFVYATHFNIDADLVASSMVACTFLSAPLMFVSAKMLTLTNLKPSNYINDLDSFLFDISIISAIATLWVIGVFLVSKKWKKIPHFFTLCLVISQFLGCLGVLLWSTLGCCDETWQLYLQFVFISLGVFGSRIWTALLALSLYFLRTRSLCFVLNLRPYFIVIGWGVPAVIAAVLLSTVNAETDHATKADPNFQYGQTQAIVAVVVLISSFLVTVTCLILQQRYGKKYNEYQIIGVEDDSESAQTIGVLTPVSVTVADIEDFGANLSRIHVRRRVTDDNSTIIDQNTIDEFPDQSSIDPFLSDDQQGGTTVFCASDNCTSRQQQQCAQIVRRYNASPAQTEPEEAVSVDQRSDEYQTLRHVVLLLVLTCSMFVGIALCMWTIIMEQASGIYLELLFLDGVLNYGQGFLVCLIFGFDDKLIVEPLTKKWRKLWSGARSLGLPQFDFDAVDPEAKLICQQFRSFHMEKCVQDLVKDRRWRLRTYKQVFIGKELVDWLILVGLAHDRSDALRYGRHLLNGRLIRHFRNEYHFYDRPFFYTFLKQETST